MEVTTTQLKNQTAEIINTVFFRSETVTVKKHGKVVARIVPPDLAYLTEKPSGLVVKEPAAVPYGSLAFSDYFHLIKDRRKLNSFHARDRTFGSASDFPDISKMRRYRKKGPEFINTTPDIEPAFKDYFHLIDRRKTKSSVKEILDKSFGMIPDFPDVSKMRRSRKMWPTL